MAHGQRQPILIMKLIYSSPNSAEAGLVESFLDTTDIAYEVRNDAMSHTLPGSAFAAEIWVLRDEDYAEASALIASFFEKSKDEGTGRKDVIEPDTETPK